jgi:hypothetical protein
MKRTLFLVVFWLSSSQLVFAQNKINVFPQVADGVFGDGTYYKSSFTILPWFDTTAVTCTLRLNGLTINLNNAQRAALFTINIPAGGYYVGVTAADQSIKTGYAVLTCSEYVYAQALYSYYAANGVKLAEATIFAADADSSGSFSYRMVADQRNTSQLGIAIANESDLPRDFRLTINGRTGTVQVPGRSSVSKFLTDMVPGSANSVGVVKVEPVNLSDNFYVIGLRFTGVAFTTIPAN